MKKLNLAIFAVAIVALLFCIGPAPALPAVLGAFLVLFVVGNLLGRPQPGATPRLCVTLTVSEILSDVLEAFKTRVPGLKYFSTDFSIKNAKYGQTIISHLPTIPTVFDHVAATGYNANAQNARDLLTDVPIVMDGWKDVQIKILHNDAEQDRSLNYLKTISNAGYALGKSVVDYALGKVVAASFSQVTIESTANTSRDTLEKIRSAMNLVNAGTPRNILASTAFFGALDADPRIASSDYHGQQIGGSPYGHLQNVGGFANIDEYPAFPANAHNLTAIAFDQRAIGIATRLPEDSTMLAQQLGIPVTYKHEVVQDPESRLALAGFGYIDPNTHHIYVAVTVMFGAVAGSQTTGAGLLLDYAGHRVVTA